jgi:CxxC motif-containing protein (DUF1111 family)
MGNHCSVRGKLAPTRTWVWAAVVVCAAGAIAASAGSPQDPPKGADSAEKCPEPDKFMDAPAGFDDKTNGFEEQAEFDDDKTAFEEVETIDDGLGPVYNATSCVGCHQNPVTGGSSQVAELRAGRREPDPADPNPRKVKFREAQGGSLIQQRAIDPVIQETVNPQDDVRTLRMSNTVLGSGFIEVIPDCEILKNKVAQRKHGMEGFAVVVVAAVEPKKPDDVTDLEFVQVERIGRFGWKCQEASLLNFSAGAYQAEMGITSPLQPEENTSNGRDVSMFDQVMDPEDPRTKAHPFGKDVQAFTRFMRSTKVSPRDPALVGTDDAVEGEKLFKNDAALGCAICHRPEYKTPLAGTKILHLDGKTRGSDMETVPAALGGKVIRPYSDFLLHDIGTGDGIAQTQHADLPPRGFENRIKIPDDTLARNGVTRIRATPERGKQRVLDLEDPKELEQRAANRMRTAPLWGLRTRPQLMHDGLSLTIEDAILRHKGQAEGVRLKFEALTDNQKRQLLTFLKSL